jgi:hypothetical protein
LIDVEVANEEQEEALRPDSQLDDDEDEEDVPANT